MLIEKYNYTPCDRETINGKRHYCLPDGSKVPSVTTILDKTKSAESKAALANWRKAVGEQRAQQITTEAANRGTRMHSYLEHYVKTGKMKDLPGNPFAQPSWFMAAQVILEGFAQVNEVWGVEVPVYYSGLYAGTTDSVGVHNKAPAIMDYKQTNKLKKREYISDYFVQLAAYAQAHNNMYGTDIKKGVILMCQQPKELEPGVFDTPVYQEFVLEGSEFDHYCTEWNKRVEQYYLAN
jgi:ATP-dependent exoDNAse (exonuclease V) beta subunit